MNYRGEKFSNNEQYFGMTTRMDEYVTGKLMCVKDELHWDIIVTKEEIKLMVYKNVHVVQRGLVPLWMHCSMRKRKKIRKFLALSINAKVELQPLMWSWWYKN